MRSTQTKILLALAAALGVSAAGAAQWVPVATVKGDRIELDKSRVVRKADGKTTAWSRLALDRDFIDEQGMRYTAIEALNRQLRKAINTKASFPHRGRRPQAHLPRHPQRRPAMHSNPGMDQSTAGVQNPLRRPTARLDAYTVTRTPSVRAPPARAGAPPGS